MDRAVMNFGCGPTLAEGWVNVDREAYHESSDEFFHVDITNGLPWGDKHFDGIAAHHSLQCLCAHELDPAVRELRRVMKPNGVLRVSVPDVTDAFLAWMHGKWDWPGFAAISEEWDPERKMCHYLTWGGQNRSCFTEYTLAGLLLRNGFRTVTRERGERPSRLWGLDALDSRLGESIIVEALA